MGPEVIADLIDGHVLLQASKGETDNSALGDIQARPADQASNAGFFEELEEAFVEVQGGWP